MRKVPYDSKKDFEYIMQFAEYTQPFCVRKDHPANSWKEWLEWAKKNVDKATYCTSGPGSGPHVFMQEIFNIEKIKPVHIPFGGGIECVTAVLAGNVNAVLDSFTVPHIKSGELKAFAVEPEHRLSSLPDIPTFKELGYPEVRAPLWLGLGAPGKTPDPILKKLDEAFTKAAKEPAFREMMTKMGGMEVLLRDRPTFRKIVEDDFDYYSTLIRRLGIKPQ
jgi:tripartite-type tricarboxylate transporter receptor subunit TctC